MLRSAVIWHQSSPYLRQRGPPPSQLLLDIGQFGVLGQLLLGQLQLLLDGQDLLVLQLQLGLLVLELLLQLLAIVAQGGGLALGVQVALLQGGDPLLLPGRSAADRQGVRRVPAGRREQGYWNGSQMRQ